MARSKMTIQETEPNGFITEPITDAELDAPSELDAELARLTNLPAEPTRVIAWWLQRAYTNQPVPILLVIGRHAHALATRLASILGAEPRVLPERLDAPPTVPTCYIAHAPVSLPSSAWSNLTHASRSGVPVIIASPFTIPTPLPFGDTLTIFANGEPAAEAEWGIPPAALSRPASFEMELALRSHRRAEAHALARTEPLLSRILNALTVQDSWCGTPFALASLNSTTPREVNDSEILQRVSRIAPALELFDIHTAFEFGDGGWRIVFTKRQPAPALEPEQEDPFLRVLRERLLPSEPERYRLAERVWSLATRLNFPALEYGYRRRVAQGRFAYEQMVGYGSVENLSQLLLALQELGSPRDGEPAGERDAPEPVLV